MTMALRPACILALASPLVGQSFPAHGLAAVDMSPFTAEQQSYTAEDLDGDGHVDLVASSTQLGQSGALVQLGSGGSSFAPAVLTPGLAGKILIVGQFTNDALRDVLTIRTFADHADLVIFAGTGTAALASPVGSTILTTSPVMASLDTPPAADLNGDGVQDVVFVTGGASLNEPEGRVALATGSGGFVPGPAFTKANGLANNARDVRLGDTDADGDLDAVFLLAVSNPAKPSLQVFRNAGNATFTTLTPAAGFGQNLMSGAIADLDGDGLSDLVIETASSRVIAHGLGQNSFAVASMQPGVGTGQTLLADLNADGLLDIAGGPATDATPYLRVDRAVSSFVFEALAPQAFGGMPRAMGLRDADGDGVPDALASLMNPSCALVAHGLGDGTFRTPRHVAAPAVILTLAGGDVDGDGDADVFAGGPTGVAISLNETGVLGPATSLGLPAPIEELAAGDLDGDGLCDVVANGLNSATPLSISLNLTSGGAPIFGPFQGLGAGEASRIVLADLDLDGDLDLLAARPETNAIDVFFGSGSGGFGPHAELAVGIQPSDVAVADMNGDGKPDIAAANGSVTWLPGLGAGAFGLGQELVLPLDAKYLALGDLDSDGKTDLAVAASDTVDTFRGTGGANFVLAGSVPLDLVPYGLRTADLDRDGRTDVIAPAKTRSRLQLLRGVGDGTLQPAPMLAVGGYAATPVIADFDADGWLDLATGADEPNEIWTHGNLHSPHTNLGFALAASAGEPELRVTGVPAAAQTVTLALAGLPVASPSQLVFGLAQQNKAFKGGVLVPVPLFAAYVPAGMPIAGPWPALPPGTAIFSQGWFALGGEFAASNAIGVVTQ